KQNPMEGACGEHKGQDLDESYDQKRVAGVVSPVLMSSDRRPKTGYPFHGSVSVLPGLHSEHGRDGADQDQRQRAGIGELKLAGEGDQTERHADVEEGDDEVNDDRVEESDIRHWGSARVDGH